MSRRIAYAVACAVVALAPISSWGESYPMRPVHLIVPIAPGGAIDYSARVLAQKLSDELGQSVVVDNRPGGDSLIGADLVAKAPPDGYTLLYTSSHTLVVDPYLYAKLPFDPVKDFAPVALCCTMDQAIVVNASLHVDTLKDLIALARQKPGSLTYGSMGTGSSGHLNMEALERQAGIDLLHVPYRGSAPAITDLIAGHISAMVVMLGVVQPYIQDGRVKALAVGSPQRSALFPDVPTAAEAGLPGYDASDWMAIFAPAATQRDIVLRLNAAVTRAVTDPEFARQRLETRALTPKVVPVDALPAFLDAERKRWGALVRLTGAKVD